MPAGKRGRRFRSAPPPDAISSRPGPPDLVFVSCSDSRVDRNFLARLMLHLRVLENEGSIEIFIHDALLPGTLWQQETRSHIDRAVAAILLISPEYLVSADLMEDQLPRLLQQAQERGTAILPLLVRPSMFCHLPKLSCFKPFNPTARTLLRMGAAEREEFLLSVAETAEEVIRHRRPGHIGGIPGHDGAAAGFGALRATTSAE